MGALEGRRILVVGASKGIGRAIAARLDEESASVAIAGRSANLLESVAAECGSRPLVVPCDVRDPEQCEQLVARTVAALGGLDALVYTPGTTAVTELVWVRPRRLMQLPRNSLPG